MKLVKCNKCKWVHFEIKTGATPEQITLHDNCFRCGNTYKNFVKAEDKDSPLGSTIQGIRAVEK